MKRGTDGGRRYMPTWTLAELELFRKEIFTKENGQMDESDLRDKFDVYVF